MSKEIKMIILNHKTYHKEVCVIDRGWQGYPLSTLLFSVLLEHWTNLLYT